MMNQQMVKSYHLRIQLNGIPEPLYYAVDQAESEWLQHPCPTSNWLLLAGTWS
jgi:hypothetical protein